MKLLQHALQSLLVIASIFAIALALTFYAFYEDIKSAQLNQTKTFEEQQKLITSAIDDKLHIYEQLLRSGSALFYSSDNVTREEWQLFVETVQLNKHWPGIQGIGYSIPVSKAQVHEHENTIRAGGFTDYELYPKGDRDFYTAIIYLEPFDWRNQRAFGYDMWSNPTRKDAMKRAMESGNTHASGVITLVQETQNDIQKGFLIYTPVYEQHPSNKDHNQRLRGWVYAPFRINDFMAQLLTSQSPTIQIYDVTDPNRETKLYQKTSDTPASAFVTSSRHLDVFGRRWRIDYLSPSFQIANNISYESKISLATSLTLDLLLLVILLLFRYSERNRTEAFNHRYATLISNLNQRTSEIESQQQTINALENEVHTLQTWLQEREVRIKELKIVHSKDKFEHE